MRFGALAISLVAWLAAAPDAGTNPRPEPEFVWHPLLPDGGDAFDATRARLGALDRELIRKVIHADRKSVRACWEKHHQLLRYFPKTSVNFVIGADGRVAAIKATGDGENRPLTRCIGEAASKWRFPPPDGGVVIITYPFIICMAAE